MAATLQGCRLDTPLSSRGRRQVEALAVRLADEEIDHVVSSPMSRAKDTALTLAAPHGLGVTLDVDLVEFDWGEWTGRPLDDALERQVSTIRDRWRLGETNLTTPSGESPLTAAHRARRSLVRLRDSGALAPLIVAHGRFNRVLMAVLLGKDLSRMDEIRQQNASLSIFEWNGDGAATALLSDDVSHLSDELRAVYGKSDSLK